jgi:hypothetical protein
MGGVSDFVGDVVGGVGDVVGSVGGAVGDVVGSVGDAVGNLDIKDAAKAYIMSGGKSICIRSSCCIYRNR